MDTRNPHDPIGSHSINSRSHLGLCIGGYMGNVWDVFGKEKNMETNV